MRLNTEDYKRAEGCLKRYNYNCVRILNIRADIMSVSIPSNDGMPKAPYNISDSVYNQYIKLQEDVELQNALKEYKAVRQALELVNEDCKRVFENYYQKQKSRWETIEDVNLSERTFVRRKGELIHTVDKELKKLA
jgi:DNA-directed RNA polymerase specialized sigma subunit